MQKQLTSWSFSRYGDYRQCPLKAKLKHLDKVKEPPSAAMARGAEIHDLIRDYVRGTVKRLPPGLKPSAELIKRIREKHAAGTAVVEQDWSFTKDWTKTRWDDWDNCWVRIKVDAAWFTDSGKGLVIVDWKTGKFRSGEAETKYTEQLELYALAALLLYPQVEVVAPQLVYLDAGVAYPEEDVMYKRKDVEPLKKTWARRTRAMLSDKIFAPRPNEFCRFCHYRASNKDAGGGQCRY